MGVTFFILDRSENTVMLGGNLYHAHSYAEGMACTKMRVCMFVALHSTRIPNYYSYRNCHGIPREKDANRGGVGFSKLLAVRDIRH